MWKCQIHWILEAATTISTWKGSHGWAGKSFKYSDWEVAGCMKHFPSVLSIMLLDCLKLCRVFKIWFLTERKSSIDCSVKGAAGKMQNAGAGSSSESWDERILGGHYKPRCLLGLLSWHLFSSFSLSINCQELNWSCTFRCEGSVGEFLLLLEGTSPSFHVLWAVSQFVKVQFPAVFLSLLHWFLARPKLMLLFHSAFLGL